MYRTPSTKTYICFLLYYESKLFYNLAEHSHLNITFSLAGIIDLSLVQNPICLTGFMSPGDRSHPSSISSIDAWREMQKWSCSAQARLQMTKLHWEELMDVEFVQNHEVKKWPSVQLRNQYKSQCWIEAMRSNRWPDCRRESNLDLECVHHEVKIVTSRSSELSVQIALLKSCDKIT